MRFPIEAPRRCSHALCGRSLVAASGTATAQTKVPQQSQEDWVGDRESRTITVLQHR